MKTSTFAWRTFGPSQARTSTDVRVSVAAALSTAALAAALAIAAPRDAIAQWTDYSQLPGAPAGAQLEQSFRGVRQQGTIAATRWSDDVSSLYFQKDGQWHRVSLADGAITDISSDAVPSSSAERAAATRRRGGGGPPARGRQRTSERSPDGAWTISTDGANVSIRGAEGEPHALTNDGTGDAGLKYGTACWVYGEELDQHSAMWWSPDSRVVAFYRFDERSVPAYYMLGGYTKQRTRVEQERYPKPGDPNPTPSILLYRLPASGGPAGGDLIGPIDLQGTDHYVYGLEFTPDSKELLVHRLNRHQNHLELLAIDAATGKVRTVLEETQPCYQKHLPLLRFLEDGRRFIWETERSGFAQYELRSLDGSEPIPLTGPKACGDAEEYPVSALIEVNESRGDLFYTAYGSETKINPQVFRAALDGSGCVRVTPDDRHYSQPTISPDGKWVVAVDQTVAEPPSTRVYQVPSAGQRPKRALATLAEGESDPFTPRGVKAPQLLSLTAADGATTIYGKLFQPSGTGHSGGGTDHPLVVRVYGGPFFRSIENTFDPVDSATGLGFAVLQVDNRGTPGRGKAFEDATYLKLGIVDLDDQAAAVRQVDAMPGIDGTRVGILGTSYGGYMSALALLRYPDVFHAAIAEAAVTDWRNYDTIYTERYMRTPSENEAGYDNCSCVKLADKLEGKLLILHGMADDNVHPANAFQLAHELQGLNRPFEMMLYPTAGHGVGGPSAESVRWSFLTKHLLPSIETDGADDTRP